MIDRRKRFVYFIRSEKDDTPYVGVTCDVAQRLETHNSGGSSYTAGHRPWRLVVALEFSDEDSALAFERYYLERFIGDTTRPRISRSAR